MHGTILNNRLFKFIYAIQPTYFDESELRVEGWAITFCRYKMVVWHPQARVFDVLFWLFRTYWLLRVHALKLVVPMFRLVKICRPYSTYYNSSIIYFTMKPIEGLKEEKKRKTCIFYYDIYRYILMNSRQTPILNGRPESGKGSY